KDYLALYLLSQYLDSDFKGSLQEILVYKEELADDFYTDSTYFHFLDPWSFQIVATTSSEDNIDKIQKVIHERLDQIAKEGINPDDLERARKYVYNNWVMGLDGIYDKASFLGTALTSALTVEEVNQLPENLKKVTSSDIQRVVQKYL